MTSIKKSIENVENLGSLVKTLQRQMASPLQWPREVVDPILHRTKETARNVTILEKKVEDVKAWQPGIEEKIDGALSVSKFDMWFKNEFNPIAEQATTSPKSDFEAFVAQMEEIEKSLGIRAESNVRQGMSRCDESKHQAINAHRTRQPRMTAQVMVQQRP